MPQIDDDLHIDILYYILLPILAFVCCNEMLRVEVLISDCSGSIIELQSNINTLSPIIYHISSGNIYMYIYIYAMSVR